MKCQCQTEDDCPTPMWCRGKSKCQNDSTLNPQPIIMIDKTTPRWNKAILLSASHFMSGVPAGMTGMELIDTLLDEETPLPEDMLLWESLDADRLDLVEHISSLAEDFYNFPL